MGSSGSSQKIQINNYSSIKPSFFIIKKTNYFMRNSDDRYYQQVKVHELYGTLMKKKMTIYLTGTIGLYGMMKPADEEFSTTPMKQVPNLLVNTNKTSEIEILYENIGVLYVFTENYVTLVIMYNKVKLFESMFPKKLFEPFNPFYINCPSENLVIDFLQGYCSFDKLKDFKCIQAIDTIHLTPNECSSYAKKIIPSKDYNTRFEIPIVKILGHLFPPNIKFTEKIIEDDIITFTTNRGFDVSANMYEKSGIDAYFLRLIVILSNPKKKIIINIKINELIKAHTVMYNSSTGHVNSSHDTDFERVFDWIAKHCVTHDTFVNIGLNKSNINISYKLMSGVRLFVKTEIMVKNDSFVQAKKKIYDLFYSE